jgi:UDP-N-acetyl-2-amino-2-deoxyglucuronate dehydrogenase
LEEVRVWRVVLAHGNVNARFRTADILAYGFDGKLTDDASGGKAGVRTAFTFVIAMKSPGEIMRVGIIGTGAIARKHADVYQKIGYEIVACTNRSAVAGIEFAKAAGAEFVPTSEELCRHPRVDFVDVCTLPDYRLCAVELCAEARKPIFVQKPMATTLATATRMVEVASAAGIQLGVVSQHRFDDSILFLNDALAAGRLGRILQADAYVKWYRSAEYYARPGKGTWAVEGGGALITQAIHQVDLLLQLAGAVNEVFAYWQKGALHSIESEDVISVVLRYASGATGIIQASTAFWPGSPERLEFHGTKGAAVITGDRLTTWSVRDDAGGPPPLPSQGASGASDPMAISTLPFERQFLDFGEACRTGRPPRVSWREGWRALQLVTAIYQSAAENKPVAIEQSLPG